MTSLYVLLLLILFSTINTANQQTDADYERVSEDIITILDRPGFDDGSLGPIMTRLAWHSSGTYDKYTYTGGSNGATMRFAPEVTDRANGGLKTARDALEPIKVKYPWITYADLWTLSAVTAIRAMGGPKIPWTPGRIDLDPATVTVSQIPPNGRLPDGSQDASHVRDVFSRLGFTDRETVALCGAHTLGRCHRQSSLWEGPWTHSPTKFSNQYFKNLIKTNWTLTTLDTGRQQFIDPNNEIMMLPTDMAFLMDAKYKPYVERYAADQRKFFADFSCAFAKLLELGVYRVTPYKK